jgi:tetratricopeptide (TPR) repeat protein
VVALGDQPVSAWKACDAIYQQTLQAVAAGAPESTWRGMLKQMQTLAAGDAMESAGRNFERALAADRWYANASSRLGQLLLFQGRFEECLEVSRRTLKTLEAFESHERMGAAAYFMGDAKMAREHWQTCLTRRPEMAAFYQALLDAVAD